MSSQMSSSRARRLRNAALKRRLYEQTCMPTSVTDLTDSVVKVDSGMQRLDLKMDQLHTRLEELMLSIRGTQQYCSTDAWAPRTWVSSHTSELSGFLDVDSVEIEKSLNPGADIFTPTLATSEMDVTINDTGNQVLGNSATPRRTKSSAGISVNIESESTIPMDLVTGSDITLSPPGAVPISLAKSLGILDPQLDMQPETLDEIDEAVDRSCTLAMESLCGSIDKLQSESLDRLDKKFEGLAKKREADLDCLHKTVHGKFSGEFASLTARLDALEVASSEKQAFSCDNGEVAEKAEKLTEVQQNPDEGPACWLGVASSVKQEPRAVKEKIAFDEEDAEVLKRGCLSHKGFPFLTREDVHWMRLASWGHYELVGSVEHGWPEKKT